MTWWLWTGVWLLLVAGALVLAFLAIRSLWRKGMALARELAEISEQVGAATEGLQPAPGGAPAADLAVFRSPAQLRAERFQARRARAVRPVPAASPGPERERVARRA